MFHLSRRVTIFLAFAIIVVGGYTMSRLSFSSAALPSEFGDARLQGALISQDIVNLSNQLAGDLEKVNELDKERKYVEALTFTSDLLKKSEEVRNKAVELSNELSKMTASLSGVKSSDARGAALESIADRLALINRLINYSDYLAKLLNTLRDKFSGTEGVGHEVGNLISQINAEVTAINNFNRQAGQAMDKFDEILRK